MADLTALKKEFSEVSDFLIALGDEKRQAIILALLADKACQGIRVGDLRETVNLSRPAISHHLKILREAKLIDYRTEGTKNYYYLTHETNKIEQLQKLLTNVTTIISQESSK